ncbi:effector-associated constant component EACC1 [Streptomyces phaeochromogenes]
MRIQIAGATEEDRDTVADLYRWMRQDQDLRQQAQVRLTASSEPAGSMGAMEIIDLILSQGFSALSLTLSYAAWRHARPSAPAVTFIVVGNTVTAADASEETIQRLTQALNAAQANSSEHE